MLTNRQNKKFVGYDGIAERLSRWSYFKTQTFKNQNGRNYQEKIILHFFYFSFRNTSLKLKTKTNLWKDWKKHFMTLLSENAFLSLSRWLTHCQTMQDMISLFCYLDFRFKNVSKLKNVLFFTFMNIFYV